MGLFFLAAIALRVVAQMPERDVGTAVYGEGHSRPAQPHSRPSTAAGENAPRQDIPLDWVRGVERLHRLPAHAGVPQHRWGVFLNDFDQFIHGRGGWAERAADRARLQRSLIWGSLWPWQISPSTHGSGDRFGNTLNREQDVGPRARMHSTPFELSNRVSGV